MAIVDDYIAEWRNLARYEMRQYTRQTSLEQAIREATLSQILLPNGKRKRHPHQRQAASLLEEAERKLQSVSKQIGQARSFEELHTLIEHELAGTKHIGDLSIYDFSHRIGAYLKVEPKVVYLHRGTRDGGRALGFNGKWIEVSSLPEEFGRLTASEIEDCLCLYKDRLRALARETAGFLG